MAARRASINGLNVTNLTMNNVEVENVGNNSLKNGGCLKNTFGAGSIAELERPPATSGQAGATCGSRTTSGTNDRPGVQRSRTRDFSDTSTFARNGTSACSSSDNDRRASTHGDEVNTQVAGAGRRQSQSAAIVRFTRVRRVHCPGRQRRSDGEPAQQPRSLDTGPMAPCKRPSAAAGNAGQADSNNVGAAGRRTPHVQRPLTLTTERPCRRQGIAVVAGHLLGPERPARIAARPASSGNCHGTSRTTPRSGIQTVLEGVRNNGATRFSRSPAAASRFQPGETTRPTP